MSLFTSSCSSRSSHQAIEKEYSLVNKYESLLISILGAENFKRVRELPKNTFDPLLWTQLNQRGPTPYHWTILDELAAGYLWIQEEEYTSEVIIHWSDWSGWIYRASPDHKDEKGEILIERYMAPVMNTCSNMRRCPREDFPLLINKYLTFHQNPKQPISQSSHARQFQRELGLIPIIFHATQAACAKINQIGGKFGTDLSVVLGVNGENGEKFNPREGGGTHLATISKYFLTERLIFIHEQEGKPQSTSEPVAPAIRTQEAYRQLSKLRTMQLEKGQEIDTHGLERERSVPRITAEKAVAEKCLNDLRAWLTLMIGGIKFEAHAFEVVESNRRKAKESIELSIDFQDDAWKLQSRFIEKR